MVLARRTDGQLAPHNRRTKLCIPGFLTSRNRPIVIHGHRDLLHIIIIIILYAIMNAKTQVKLRLIYNQGKSSVNKLLVTYSMANFYILYKFVIGELTTPDKQEMKWEIDTYLDSYINQIVFKQIVFTFINYTAYM